LVSALANADSTVQTGLLIAASVCEMSDPVKSGHFAAMMRRLDEILAEAVRLREQITTTMRNNQERPFWPDRRIRREPHDPERRHP
jgi:hypothetical protein